MTRDLSQEEIIYADADKSCLIIAPPGFGKTRTMGRRIEYLIQNSKIKESKKILGLTFTNAAASEMQKSLNLSDQELGRIEITTYHSFCYKVLKNYGYEIEINRNFGLIGEIEQNELIKSILRTYNLSKSEIKNLAYEFISWKKSHFKENVIADKKGGHDSFFHEIHKEYINMLTENNNLDFDLLIEKTLELWKERPRNLCYYQKKYGYVLLDEFQDTNEIQYLLFKTLIKKSEGNFIPFMCFGDDYQSIYIFQGAMASSITRVTDEFKCELKKLENNYRNSCVFIDTLNDLLRSGSTPHIPDTFKKVCYLFKDIESESEFIINVINILDEEEISYGEVCIISREYKRLEEIRSKLVENNIPFIYLKEFRNKEIEKKFKELFKMFDDLITDKKSSGKILDHFSDIYENDRVLDDIVLKIMRDYIKEFEKEKDVEGLPLWKRIQELKNDIYLNLNWGKIIRENVYNKIFLSAVHQVKGLEFYCVFFIGVENYSLPTSYFCSQKCPPDEVKDFKEEGNILYVGITRMKDKLLFTGILLTDGRKRRKLSCLLEKISDLILIKINEDGEWINEDYSNMKCWRLD